MNIIDKSLYNVYTIGVGDQFMETKIQRWGNSDGIRIPSSILKSLDLKTNDKVNIKEDNNKIIITKVVSKRNLLQNRINKYQGENLTKEFSWDEPKGNEIW